MKKALFTMFIFGIFAIVAFSTKASAQSFWYGNGYDNGYYGNDYYQNSYYYNYNNYSNYYGHNNYSNSNYGYNNYGYNNYGSNNYGYYQQPYYGFSAYPSNYGYGGGMNFGLTFIFR